jgi:hypothetical protein
MNEQLLTELNNTARNLPETELRLIVNLAKRLPQEAALQAPAGARVIPQPEAATDRELNSQYGNPTVYKDPPRWNGESYAGMTFSECPADYLDALASFFEWRAQKEEEEGKVDSKGRPRAEWSRKDAKLARGWAKRVQSRLGASTAVASPPQDMAGFGDDNMPF